MSFNRMVACCLGGLVTLASNATAQDVSRTFETRAEWHTKCPNAPSAAEPDRQSAYRVAIGALIVAAVAPKLVEGVIDAASESLKAAGSDRSDVSRTRISSDFYGVQQEGDLRVQAPCLVLIRGIYDPKKKSPFSFPEIAGGGSFKDLQRPIFWLEAQIKALPGRKHFQLVPVFLKVDDFERFDFFDVADRDYLIALSLYSPGEAQPFASADLLFNKITRGQTMKFGDWPLRSATTRPMAFPAESTDTVTAKAERTKYTAPFVTALSILKVPDKTLIGPAPPLFSDVDLPNKIDPMCAAIVQFNKSAPESAQLSEADCAYRVTQEKARLAVEKEAANRNAVRVAWAKDLCPDGRSKTAPQVEQVLDCVKYDKDSNLDSKTFTQVTTEIVLTETREGSKLALFAGKVLGSAKEDISKALKDELPKTPEQKAALETAARDARRGVTLADLTVIQAEEALAAALALSQEGDQPSKTTAARIALAKAKIAANDAYRAANLTPPYSEFE